MYLCSVIKKQRLQEAAGASQSPANRSYLNEKKADVTGTPARKKKDTYLSNCSKFKDTYFSCSYKILVKNTFFEKYRINVYSIFVGGPVHFYSLEFFPVGIVCQPHQKAAETKYTRRG